MVEINLIALVFFSLLTLGAAFWVFMEKRIMNAVLALTMVFLGSAAVFFILQQRIAAILQLLIFIGGLSAYLIVSIGSEEHMKEVNTLHLILFSIVFVGALLLFSFSISSTEAVLNGNDFLTAISSVFVNYYALLYVLVFLLFTTAVGSVLVIKKFTRLLV